MTKQRSDSKINFPIFTGRGIVIAAAIAVGVGSLSSTFAHAAKYKSLKSGGWSGGVYVHNQTGKFKSCVMSAKYKSGIKLLFSVNDRIQWNVGFSKNSWKLTKGKRYPVHYRVDKTPVQSAQARAASNKLAVIDLPNSSKLFTRMRKGRLLRVKAGDDILAFKLTGTNRMLNTLLKCARYYKGKILIPPKTAKSNPFEKSDTPFKQGNPSPKNGSTNQATNAFRQEARSWFNTHLAAASDEYIRIANKGNGAKMYKKNAIVWRVGKGTGIIGTLRIYPTRTTGYMNKSVLSFEARVCKGDFASRRLEKTGFKNEAANRLMAICRQKDGVTWSSYYAIFNRKAGGSSVITIYSQKSDTQTVETAGERLTGVLQTSNTPDPVALPDTDDLPERTEAPVVRY
ncbi:MAG: hypothetical protein V3V02_10605 [Rhizobiaceae bacterium]